MYRFLGTHYAHAIPCVLAGGRIVETTAMGDGERTFLDIDTGAKHEGRPGQVRCVYCRALVVRPETGTCPNCAGVLP